MAKKLLLTGDVNLMNVVEAAEPFRKIVGELHAADVVFGNMECCLHLPASRHSHANEGFFADPVVGGEALKFAGIHAVGIANNVNYGAANIAASIARLDEIGVHHTGAGPNLAAARAPAIVERGLRVGVLQRSSVYWPTDHEASVDAPGTRSCAAIPPIRCRWVGRTREFRRPIGRAFHPRSSPGPTRPMSRSFAKISRRSASRSTFSLPPVTGASDASRCNT